MPTSLGWSGLSQGKKFPPGDPRNKKETYAASIDQSASDYDEVMQRYRDFLAKPIDSRMGGLAAQYQGLADRADKPYKRGPDVAASMANMAELSQSGGYTPGGIQELRARGVSPIRSVYAQAQSNIDRNRSLSGGYSPNHTAATAKMAREMSEGISGQISNVNAGIAQNVAGNRLSAGPQYADAAMRETDLINRHNQQNVGNKMAALGGLGGIYGQQNNAELEAIGGMRSMYGTTPANPALYGAQAAQARGLEQQDQQLNQQASGMLMQAYRPPVKRLQQPFRLG